jgi:hypothetical protein
MIVAMNSHPGTLQLGLMFGLGGSASQATTSDDRHMACHGDVHYCGKPVPSRVMLQSLPHNWGNVFFSRDMADSGVPEKCRRLARKFTFTVSPFTQHYRKRPITTFHSRDYFRIGDDPGPDRGGASRDR